jgi:hypothetical protein
MSVINQFCQAAGALNDLYRLDPRTTVWSKIISNDQNAPSPRNNFGFIAASNSLLLFGGEGSYQGK